MANYETEEQQVEALKEWWKENGKVVLFGALLGFGAVFGYQAWDSYMESQRQAASLAYNQLGTALTEGRTQSVIQQGEHLIKTYPASSYASMAALAMARVYVGNDDLAGAHARLQWVLDNGKHEDLKAIARIRLARVLLADNKANLALTTLQAGVPQAYKAQYHEVEGDIHLALSQPDQARSAYALALEALGPADDRTALEMKLDDLGA